MKIKVKEEETFGNSTLGKIRYCSFKNQVLYFFNDNKKHFNSLIRNVYKKLLIFLVKDKVPKTSIIVLASK